VTGKTHLLIGLGTGLLLCHIAQPQTVTIAAAVIALAGLGSLLPDVDTPQSTINRLIPPLMLISLFVKHRGFSHSIFIPAITIVAGVVLTIAPVELLIIAGAIGYLSHLVADAVTIQGIPLLSPLPYTIHLLPKPFRLTTGGIIENLLGLSIVLGILYYAYLVQPYRLPL
jgi:inner membrane protein